MEEESTEALKLKCKVALSAHAPARRRAFAHARARGARRPRVVCGPACRGRVSACVSVCLSACLPFPRRVLCGAPPCGGLMRRCPCRRRWSMPPMCCKGSSPASKAESATSKVPCISGHVSARARARVCVRVCVCVCARVGGLGQYRNVHTRVCVCVWGVGVGGGVLDQCKNECLFPLQCKFRNAHFYAGVQRADVQRALRSGEAPIHCVCRCMCVHNAHHTSCACNVRRCMGVRIYVLEAIHRGSNTYIRTVLEDVYIEKDV